MGMGREAGTPFINGDHMGIHKNRDGMGWDGMRLMCHLVGGCRCDCVIGNVGLYVRSSTGPHVPNNQLRTGSKPYTVIICRLLYSVFSKDEGLHKTKCALPPNLATQPQTQHKQVDEK